MRRILAAFALFMAFTAAQPFAPPAEAAGASKKAEDDAGSARSLDVLNLVVPVVVEGRLVNYLFVSLRVQIADGVDVWRMRERGHFVRDAMLKAVHRTSIAGPRRTDELNRPAATGLFAAAAREALGANAVASIEILAVSSLKRGEEMRA